MGENPLKPAQPSSVGPPHTLDTHRFRWLCLRPDFVCTTFQAASAAGERPLCLALITGLVASNPAPATTFEVIDFVANAGCSEQYAGLHARDPSARSAPARNS